MVTALNDNLLDAWVEDDNLQSGGDPDCQPLYRPLCLKPVVVACTHAKLKLHEDCPSQVCWSLNDILLTFVIAFGTMIADHNTVV